MGDMVDIRIDLKVTTTAANQEFTFRYEFGSGSGTPFYIDLGTIIEKAAGQYGYLDYTGIYMGNSLVLDNPSELQFDTDSAATVEVGGFYIKVTRR
jgi:hypothetical protein